MVTTSDLAKSIASMSKEEMEKRLLEIRKNLREPPKKEVKAKTTKAKQPPQTSQKELSNLVKAMSPEDRAKLLEALGGA